MPPGASGDPDGRGSMGSRATSPRAVPCNRGTSLLGGKTPQPNPTCLCECFSPQNQTRRPSPQAGRGLLAGAPTVAVALLLVGPVRGVPLQQVGVVGQHHLDSLQRLGDGSLLQGTPLLRDRAGWGSVQPPGGGRHPAPPCRGQVARGAGDPGQPHSPARPGQICSGGRTTVSPAGPRHRSPPGCGTAGDNLREGSVSAPPGWPDPRPRGGMQQTAGRCARTHPARTSHR